jgi:Mg2+ and Co2+ transporter CorA
MHAEGHLLLVLHKVPRPGDPERPARLFWRDPAGAWQSSDGGTGAGELHEHLAEYDRVVDAIEAQARVADEADEFFAIVRAVTPLLRAVRHLHATLQQARESVDDRAIIAARDMAGELERTLELLHADATQAMQFLVAAKAEEQAASAEQIAVSSQRLNYLLAFFLPLTAAASVIGMNLKHGLDDHSERVFWTVVVACLVLGLGVVAVVAAPCRKKRPTAIPEVVAGKKR